MQSKHSEKWTSVCCSECLEIKVFLRFTDQYGVPNRMFRLVQ